MEMTMVAKVAKEVTINVGAMVVLEKVEEELHLKMKAGFKNDNSKEWRDNINFQWLFEKYLSLYFIIIHD